MRKLTEIEEQWRNYLYANYDGKYNDAEDFIARIQLIDDSHDQILETMLENNPDMELVKACKEEIIHQIDALKDLVAEFVDYYNNSDNTKDITLESLLTEFRYSATNSYLYEIAEDWQNWGIKSNNIWKKLSDSYGNGLQHIHDDLCILIMDELDAITLGKKDIALNGTVPHDEINWD